MESNQFEVKYFDIEDSTADPQNNAENPKLVYAQVEKTLTKEEHTGIVGETTVNKKVSNKGKHLMLFMDQSGSMSGTPFETLKKGCIELADTVFSESDNFADDNLFEMVHSVFFESYVHPTVTNRKDIYLKRMKDERIRGGTNFFPCLSHIEQTLNTYSVQNGQFCIIFLTDGQGSWDERAMGQLNELIHLKKNQLNVTTTIYCIGFSQYHDAKLLNRLAQNGSELGNFVYIDTNNANYPTQLKESLAGSLDMALQSQGKAKIMLTNQEANYSANQNSKTEYEFEDDDNINEDADNWKTVKYHTAFILKENELLNGSLKVELAVSQEKSISGGCTLSKIEEVPIVLRSQAEVQVINRQTFDLIQLMQSQASSVNKKEAFEKLKQIDRSLDSKLQMCMQIKQRTVKKNLIEQIMECRKRTGAVIQELRNLTDFS